MTEPIHRTNTNPSKKTKIDDACLDESSDKTLFALLKLPAKVIEKPAQDVDTGKLSTFSNLLQKFTAEHTVEVSKRTVHKLVLKICFGLL